MQEIEDQALEIQKNEPINEVIFFFEEVNTEFEASRSLSEIQSCIDDQEINTTLEKVPDLDEVEFEFERPTLLKKRESKFDDEFTLRNTRSMKRSKIDREISFDAKLDQINDQGASMLKYEFISKGSKKVLLAKRCSKRNQCLGLQAPIDIDESFEYQPNSLEELFAKDSLIEKVRL
jgi:hypothetical protein